MIKIKAANKGKLHAKLGVPSGEKIPAGKLAKALHSTSPALRKEANFAKNAKGWSHAEPGHEHLPVEHTSAHH